MKRREFLKASGVAAGVALLPNAVEGQNPPHGVMAPVLTRSYNNARNCATTHETTLTVANVKSRGMRQFFSLPMEGDARGAEAQPLIVPSVPMAQGVHHDVVIACSMNGTVWCFDANNSKILWQKDLGPAIVGSNAIDMFRINDHWATISTPVVDIETYKLYLVTWLSPDGAAKSGVHHIITMDIRTGDILKDVSLASLSYDPGHGLSLQKWSDAMRKQRSSLLMTNINGVKTVFFGSGSILETSHGASGWVVAYDVASQRVSASFALTSHWYGGGVWMAGQGLAADSNGFIYGVSGNGSFDGITDFSECCFKLQYTPPSQTTDGKLKIIDWWSPYSDAGRIGKNPSMPTPQYETPKPKLAGVSAPSEDLPKTPVNAMPDMDMTESGYYDDAVRFKLRSGNLGAYSDQDLGSSGVALIEELGLALFSGKDGILYGASMNAMGKTMPNDFLSPVSNYGKLKFQPIWFTFYPGPGVSPVPNDSSELDVMYGGKTHHMHSTPIVAKLGNEYRCWCWGENGNLRCWRINTDGTAPTYLGCSAEVASPRSTGMGGGMPGGMLSLSMNGTDPSTAIVWAAVPQGNANKEICPGNVFAYDAWNIGKYTDGSGALNLIWKSPDYTFNKFCPITVSGGRIFVNSYNDKIDIYGLA